MTTLYTGPTAVELACIPVVLTSRRQWVLWRGVDRVNQQTGKIKLNKIPIDPQTLSNADTTDPLTWGTLAQCVTALPVALEEWEQEDPSAYRGGGLGFVFTAEDPYAGVDVDGCVDKATGHIAAWAQTHVEALNSYTEITPSGTGLHILVEGTLPPKGRKKGPVEMYSYARFFTMTGWHVPKTPPTIEDRHDVLQAFHTTIFGEAQPQQDPAPSGLVTLDDTALLTKAQAAKNGARLAALLAGNWEGYSSQSEADMSLCVRLAFWSQSPEQIDRLFRLSGLMRAKWDERRGAQPYGQRTITEALAHQTEHYRVVEASTQPRNGDAPGPEPPDPYACPELPASAHVDAALASEASPFLDDYIAFSHKWAPRAYEGFHGTVALFVLATLAAHRIKIALGAGQYTSLYLVLAGRTGLFTKTTAADIGVALLKRVAPYLLAADESTPQALIRAMAGVVRPDYSDMDELQQLTEQRRLAFAAQRGWFYEEWGQHLDAMMDSHGGNMALFRSILRRMDDNKPDYLADTISRGQDAVDKPYLTLLCNVTPMDLQPFAKKDSKLWRDGFATLCEERLQALARWLHGAVCLLYAGRERHLRCRIPTRDLPDSCRHDRGSPYLAYPTRDPGLSYSFGARQAGETHRDLSRRA
jgi:hypothetical protein